MRQFARCLVRELPQLFASASSSCSAPASAAVSRAFTSAPAVRAAAGSLRWHADQSLSSLGRSLFAAASMGAQQQQQQAPLPFPGQHAAFPATFDTMHSEKGPAAPATEAGAASAGALATADEEDEEEGVKKRYSSTGPTRGRLKQQLSEGADAVDELIAGMMVQAPDFPPLDSSMRAQQPLSVKDLRYLWSRSQQLLRDGKLQPIKIGAKGLTNGVLSDIRSRLRAKELVCVHAVFGSRLDVKMLVELLPSLLDCVVLGCRGRKLTLFRDKSLPPSHPEGLHGSTLSELREAVEACAAELNKAVSHG